MSANKSERGLALMRDRERERARRFTPAHLVATGGQAVVLCRECRHFDFLDLKALPADVDLRFHEVKFRCREGHRYAVVGIARGVTDPPYRNLWERRDRD